MPRRRAWCVRFLWTGRGPWPRRAALDAAIRELLGKAGRYEQQVRVEVRFEIKVVLISLVGDEPKKWHFDAQAATIAAGAIDLVHCYWLLETPGLGDGSRVAVKDATGTSWAAGAPADGWTVETDSLLQLYPGDVVRVRAGRNKLRQGRCVEQFNNAANCSATDLIAASNPFTQALK